MDPIAGHFTNRPSLRKVPEGPIGGPQSGQATRRRAGDQGNDMTTLLSRLWKDEEGATMVEYGLMVALIAVVCILAVTAIGTQLNIKFGDVGTALGA